jgi:hypothetical protein
MIGLWEVVHFSFPFLVHFCIPVDTKILWISGHSLMIAPSLTLRDGLINSFS